MRAAVLVLAFAASATGQTRYDETPDPNAAYGEPSVSERRGNVQSPYDKMPGGDPQLRPVLQNRVMSGQVRIKGGGVPTEPAYVEVDCGDGELMSGFTDKSGYFVFTRPTRAPLGIGGSPHGDITWRFNCPVYVSLPGYRGVPGSPLLLEPLGAGEGWTVSFTTWKAPEKARHAYRDAAAALGRRRIDRAEKLYREAIEAYPQYASAWHQLGALLEGRGLLEEAAAAQQKAIEIDSRFILPYVRLASVYAQQGRWDEVATVIDRVLPLNPFEAPAAWYYAGAVKLLRRDIPGAEAATRKAIDFDPDGRYPEFRRLLGSVLAGRGDGANAAASFREYLSLRPQAGDRAKVENWIARLENRP